MVGVYFSGTGNTKYCIEKFLKALDWEAEALPIEDPAAIDNFELYTRSIYEF